MSLSYQLRPSCDSYDRHSTVTTFTCSYDQPPDFDFDRYDRLAHNFSIKNIDYYGMLAYQN